MISAALTVFVLTAATIGLLLFRQAPPPPAAANTAPASLVAQPAAGATGAAVASSDASALAACQVELQAANQALEEAYAQLDAIQVAQERFGLGVWPGYEHEHEYREYQGEYHHD